MILVFNPEKHHRRSLRLKGYDYSQSGLYFITLCSHMRENIFGYCNVGTGSEPVCFIGDDHNKDNSIIILNEFGTIVEDTWYDLPNHNKGIILHEFVVMPNHVHGIIELAKDGISCIQTKYKPRGTGCEPVPTIETNLSEIVRQFKTFSSRRINKLRNSPGVPVWQPRFYEHIIRDEKSFYAICRYIAENPQRWQINKY